MYRADKLMGMFHSSSTSVATLHQVMAELSDAAVSAGAVVVALTQRFYPLFNAEPSNLT